MKSRTFIILLIAMSFGLMSCNEAPAIQSAVAAKVDFFINDSQAARTQLLQEVRASNDTIEVALTSFTDTDLANALVTAKNAGATIRAVGDADFESDEGFRILEEAGIEVTYGNGEFRYLPDPTLSPILNTCGYDTTQTMVICPSPEPFIPLSDGKIVRPGEMNLMSHNFIILGREIVWNFSHPQFGGVKSIPIAFRFESEFLKESFWREFNQMFGGVFASSLSVYNGPVKSTTQWSRRYITQNGEVWMRFSPQERTVKSSIDDIYRSRGNVWIMTDSIDEDFLVDALEYKKNAGFDVRIVVRQAGQDPRLLERLQELDVRFAGANLDYLPTLIALDTQGTRGDLKETRRIHVISHPLWRTGPFGVVTASPNDRVEVFRTDYYADGVMWTVAARPEQDNPVLDQLEQGFLQIWNDAGGN